jgi:hypothetical protein
MPLLRLVTDRRCQLQQPITSLSHDYGLQADPSSLITQPIYGRGAGVGRGLGVGVHLPVHGVGVGVGVGVTTLTWIVRDTDPARAVSMRLRVMIVPAGGAMFPPATSKSN